MTVVAVGSIFLGPAIDSCAARGDDVLECLREQAGEIVEPGARPPLEEAAIEPDDAQPLPPAEPVAPALPPVDQTGVVEATEAPAEQPPELETLTVTPDGGVAIAGRGPPGEEVSVFANGELFGTATAEPDGNWTIVADTPLPPGGTAITAGDADGEALAEEAYVVVIDPQREAEPQVIPSAPDRAAEVLLEVAPALPELTPDVELPHAGGAGQEPPSGDAPPAEPDSPTGVAAATPGAVTAAPEESPATAEPPARLLVPAGERAAREVAAALADHLVVPQPDDASVPLEPATPSPAPPEPAMPSLVPVGERAAREVAAALARTREAAPVAMAAAPQEPLLPPLLPVGERAAREVAAALSDPHEVAVVVATEPEKPAVPQLLPVSERAAREVAAALANVRDVFTGEERQMEAPPSDGHAGEPAPVVPDIEPEPPQPRDPVDAAAIARGWTDALDAINAAAHMPSPATEVPPAPVDTAPAVDEPAPAEVPPPVDVAIHPALPAVPEEPEEEPVAVTAPAAPPPQPDETPAVATEQDPAPAIRAVLIRDSDLARLRPGQIVVRPGDTLWDIADRIYGDGSKYQTIYRANRDVIPRPGKLKPGQVLEIPLVYD